MPAIAASSPIRDGEFTGLMDTRLEAYRRNSARIPCITGQVIPEPVQTREEYQGKILQPIYQALAPHDPAGTLQHEWVNARGVIARFDRNTIEVRVLDTQETPAADMAVANLIIGALKLLIAQAWSTTGQQLAFATPDLAGLLLDHVKNAEQTIIKDRNYLRLFAFPDRRCETRELWQYLLESIPGAGIKLPPDITGPMHHIVQQGPLARRICKAIGSKMRRPRLQETYRQLGACLAQGHLFNAID